MMLYMLVIGLVVIITIIVKTGIFSGGDKGVLEKGLDAVEDVKEKKETLEKNYKFDPDAQEKSIDDLN